MGKILIIDDDKPMCKVLAKLVKSLAGHDAVYAHTLNQGLEIASSEPIDVVLLDVSMPDGNGLDVLSRIGETDSKPEVIIMTASGDPDGAEIAIRCGAWDYIEKTPSIKEMIAPIDCAFQYRQERMSCGLEIDLKREKIIGSSPKIKSCFEILAKAADGEANVLITGETGTGKELFARAIHHNSSRAEKNFVVVDCAALPETLVESVLFGHEKGAFTGADRAQQGLIEQADGGTLFLDEIGELPLNVQKSFLRVIQERRYRPVGRKNERESHFRLVTATNRDLNRMTQAGQFRKDLVFRLQALTIELPSLRERTEDIEELARFHVDRLCERYGTGQKDLSPGFLNVLKSYDWPGNVRELVNTIDGALAISGKDPTLFSKHLPVHLRVSMVRNAVGKRNSFSDGVPAEQIEAVERVPKLKDYRNHSERRYLLNLFAQTQQDFKQACQISGISRSRLYELLAKHKISIATTPLSALEE